MQGNYIRINTNWHQITQPELWAKSTSEEEYFRTLREQQTKQPQTLLPGVTGRHVLNCNEKINGK